MYSNHLATESTIVPVHKLIVTARSHYFKNLTSSTAFAEGSNTSNMITMDLDDAISSNPYGAIHTMQAFLYSLYQGVGDQSKKRNKVLPH